VGLGGGGRDEPDGFVGGLMLETARPCSNYVKKVSQNPAGGNIKGRLTGEAAERPKNTIRVTISLDCMLSTCFRDAKLGMV
jgi:hypothetical protein